MEWTTNKPTQPGWYWSKAKGEEIEVIELVMTTHGLREHIGCDYLNPLSDGQFAGPLDPPSSKEA